LFTEADIAAILESRAMTGAVNPYAPRKQKQQTENTNEQQQQPSSDNTAAPESGQS
jgi:hypothetical protein